MTENIDVLPFCLVSNIKISAFKRSMLYGRRLTHRYHIISHNFIFTARCYEKSLQECQLPSDWKMANVTSIFKKGNKNDAGNYRPVSLTSVPCKVLESIMKYVMVDYLESTGFYNHCQHGFVKGRPTLTNLLETLESWTRMTKVTG